VAINSADRSVSGCTLPPLPSPMNGNASWDDNNPSDTALSALVRLIDALAGKVAEGVSVIIVESNEGAAVNRSKHYGGNPKVTRDLILRRLTNLFGSRERAGEFACAKVIAVDDAALLTHFRSVRRKNKTVTYQKRLTKLIYV
jgi:hypothetical protein